MNVELKNVLEISDRIRSRILRECRITRATLCNWINARSPVPFWAREKIDAIVLQEIGRTVFSDNELANQDCMVIA